MYLDIKDNSYSNVPFYIDDIMLVEDYNTVKRPHFAGAFLLVKSLLF